MAGKADIVEAIANDTGLTRKDAAAALDSVVNAISGLLKKSDRMTLPDLSVFHIAKRYLRGVQVTIQRLREDRRVNGGRGARRV